jgi:hypothetical protein
VRIGIVIPAHDAAPWIADAIGSVLRQTHRAWSLVVVDDGSTDATAAVVQPFLADPRIALIRQDRAGVSAARNRGMAACGDVQALLFLDADDWLAPDALARLALALEQAPCAAACSGPAGFVAEHDAPGASAARLLRGVSGDVLVRLLTRNRFANGGQVLVRIEAMLQAGGFRPDLGYGEDWEFLVRIASLGRFARAAGSGPIAYIRRRGEGAYLRQATDPAAFTGCMAAIFDNPALAARLGAARVGRLRAAAAAENKWIIARALLAGGRRTEGLAALRTALAAKPSLKRAALTALMHVRPPGYPRKGGGSAATAASARPLSTARSNGVPGRTKPAETMLASSRS